MNTSASNPAGVPPASPADYTPGHVFVKLIMIGLGLGAFALGLAQLWTPFRLLAAGHHAVAEAASVTKTKPRIPDTILTDDLQIQASLEPRDRSYLFWNEFRFRTPDARTVNVRAPVGSQGRPLYPLVNSDGLPTTDVVYYDPTQPQDVVFPLIISTWFAAGSLMIGGLAALVIGTVLLYWSGKPIALPRLP